MAVLRTFIFSVPSARDGAAAYAHKAPDGTVVQFKEPTRTSDQNAKMWAMLSDVSRAKPEGRSRP
jgi:hypothetical protein